MDDDTPHLAAPEMAPHVALLIIAHVDLATRVAALFAGSGLPKARARRLLTDHASAIRIAGDAFQFQAASNDIANGLDAAAQEHFPPD